MFDRDLATRAVDAISPVQWARVATACLIRVADLLDDDRIHEEFPAASRLVHEIVGYASGRASGVSSEPVPIRLIEGVRDVLGPVDEPFEELPAWGAWVMDIISLADYVLRTWNFPEEGRRNCFNVLLAAYSIAAFLEDDSTRSDVPQLGNIEFQRQMEDISLIGRGVQWAAVVEQSRSLAQSYVRWLGAVAS